MTTMTAGLLCSLAVRAQLDEMQAIGGRNIRVLMPWGLIEQQDDTYGWSHIDDIMAAAHQPQKPEEPGATDGAGKGDKPPQADTPADSEGTKAGSVSPAVTVGSGTASTSDSDAGSGSDE